MLAMQGVFSGLRCRVYNVKQAVFQPDCENACKDSGQLQLGCRLSEHRVIITFYSQLQVAMGHAVLRKSLKWT